MVCDSLLYMVGVEMRASPFWNSVPECLREATRNEPLGEVADESHTCYCEALVAWNVDYFRCAQGRAALLGFMNH